MTLFIDYVQKGAKHCEHCSGKLLNIAENRNRINMSRLIAGSGNNSIISANDNNVTV